MLEENKPCLGGVCHTRRPEIPNVHHVPVSEKDWFRLSTKNRIYCKALARWGNRQQLNPHFRSRWLGTSAVPSYLFVNTTDRVHLNADLACSRQEERGVPEGDTTNSTYGLPNPRSREMKILITGEEKFNSTGGGGLPTLFYYPLVWKALVREKYFLHKNVCYRNRSRTFYSLRFSWGREGSLQLLWVERDRECVCAGVVSILLLSRLEEWLRVGAGHFALRREVTHTDY